MSTKITMTAKKILVTHSFAILVSFAILAENLRDSLRRQALGSAQ